MTRASVMIQHNNLYDMAYSFPGHHPTFSDQHHSQPLTQMALTVHRQQQQARHSSTVPSYRSTSYPNYHPNPEVLFPLPSKSSTMDLSSSRKHSWLEYINESETTNTKIKEEIFDESPSTPTNEVDYTIINANGASISSKSDKISNSKQQGVLMNPPVSPEEKRRCAVCNDIASGYHYGVWSCEGCKAFFKRSIQGTNEYICPATNTCTIDKHRRKSCQACRLRRCYEVGMTKGTTRRERKYRKKAVSVCKITSTSTNPNDSGGSTGTSAQEHGLLVTTTLLQPPVDVPSSLGSQNDNNNRIFSSPQQSQVKTTTTATSDCTRTSTTTPADFVAILSQASRLNLPAKVDTSRMLDDRYFLQLLAKIFDQELVVLINWAKAMPGYTESLTLDQQVTIIEQSWLDTLILDIIERSLERNDDTLHFAPDFIVSKNRDMSSPGLGSICTCLFNLLQAFKEPRTTHEEFIALKATTLINSVPTTIATTKSFRLLTNQVYQAIQYTCDSNPSVYHDNYIRHFTLLLQLPHIKMLSSRLIRFFLEMRTNDLLPQADLLLEMLDAQDPLDIHGGLASLNIDGNSISSLSRHSTPAPTVSLPQLSIPSNVMTTVSTDVPPLYRTQFSNRSTSRSPSNYNEQDLQRHNEDHTGDDDDENEGDDGSNFHNSGHISSGQIYPAGSLANPLLSSPSGKRSPTTPPYLNLKRTRFADRPSAPPANDS